MASESFLEGLREKGKSKRLKPYGTIYLNCICTTLSALHFSIANVVFTHLFQSLPRCLKRKDSYSGFFLARVLDVIEHIKVIELEENSLLMLRGMVVACLRYGLNLDYRESLSTLCLRVVRYFVCLASQPIFSISEDALFSPEQIFTMITSHSHFEVLSADRDRGRREVLVSLLICCLTFDNGKIEIKKNDFIRKLMKGFDAGLGTSDFLLRRLLAIIEEKFGHLKVSAFKIALLFFTLSTSRYLSRLFMRIRISRSTHMNSCGVGQQVQLSKLKTKY